MIGYRRAAVVLHGMHEDDRQWILSELANDDRTALNKFIGELDSLGFARDESIADRLFSLSPQKSMPTGTCDEVRFATAAQMCAVLEGEPSSLIAQVLKSADWPWAESFLRMLDPSRREKVRSLMAGYPAIALARKSVLMALLAKRSREGLRAGDSYASGAGALRPAVIDAVRQALSPVAKLVMPWKR